MGPTDIIRHWADDADIPLGIQAVQQGGVNVGYIITTREEFEVVNVNPLYTARELKHQLEDSGARAIVILENFAHTLETVIDKTPVDHVITTGVGDLLNFPRGVITNFVLRHIKRKVPAYSLPRAETFRQALKAGRHKGLQHVELGYADIAFLQYTGGTTGVAKGAMLTHRNMIANLLQAHAWTANDLVPGEEVVITALPLYHIFALLANGLFAMRMGARNILITNPRDLPAFVRELASVPIPIILYRISNPMTRFPSMTRS